MTPTPEELRDEYIRSLRAEFPDLRTGEGSLARAEATTVAALLSGLHDRLAAIERNITPYSADSPEGLAPHAETVRLPRKGATPARKARALEIRGNAGSAIPASAILRHSSGLRFQTTRAVTIPAQSDRVLADVEAIDVGSATRLQAGEPLVFQTPPAGVLQTAKLVLDLDEGGREAESFGAWRDRVISVWRQKRQGGNAADYRQWALELSFVDEVYIYPSRPARGHVGIVALKEGNGASRILVPDERAELAAAIDRQRPICDEVHIIEVTPVHVHGVVDVTTFPGHARDWDGVLSVAAWDADRGVVTVASDPPAALTIGATLTVFDSGPGQAGFGPGRPAIVASVTGRELGLAPWVGSDPLGYAPRLGDVITPSSQTLYAVWQRVTAYLATLGPANPAGRYGVWLADARAGHIQAQALAVPGVMTASITVLGLATGADFPSNERPFPDLSVDLLLPGQWVIR